MSPDIGKDFKFFKIRLVDLPEKLCNEWNIRQRARCILTRPSTEKSWEQLYYKRLCKNFDLMSRLAI